MNNTPTTDTGPGILAFIAFFLLALALWFLMRNMNARMRRMSYRQQAARRGKDDPQATDGEGPVETTAVSESDGRTPDAGQPDGRTPDAGQPEGPPASDKDA